ncbi:hypothetical protein ZWY2020_040768 [Hordeum vulgare]|nr:hypothetical protein ZWY2020_040768 [Hordeum vulgare]
MHHHHQLDQWLVGSVAVDLFLWFEPVPGAGKCGATPQADGPCPVISITNRNEFREVMDYFHGHYAACECKPCALHLMVNG